MSPEINRQLQITTKPTNVSWRIHCVFSNDGEPSASQNDDI